MHCMYLFLWNVALNGVLSGLYQFKLPKLGILKCYRHKTGVAFQLRIQLNFLFYKKYKLNRLSKFEAPSGEQYSIYKGMIELEEGLMTRVWAHMWHFHD